MHLPIEETSVTSMTQQFRGVECQVCGMQCSAVCEAWQEVAQAGYLIHIYCKGNTGEFSYVIRDYQRL